MRECVSPARFGLFVVFVLLVACEPSYHPVEEEKQQETVLRVGFPPAENAEDIIQKHQALMQYLQAKTGVNKIELSVAPSYTATIEDLQKHKLDLVNFGALSYVLAKNITNITPLVSGVTNSNSENHSLIIARNDSNIHQLKDLPGHSFAFGDVASTSGHLIPHRALLAAGINPHKDLLKLIYTGAHDKTAFAVQRGEVEAGAINARIYSYLLNRGLLEKDKTSVIWVSPPFAEYPWAIRSDLDPALIRSIQSAFITLNDSKLLESLGVDGFQICKDSDFEDIRQAAIKLGFMQKQI